MHTRVLACAAGFWGGSASTLRTTRRTISTGSSSSGAQRSQRGSPRQPTECAWRTVPQDVHGRQACPQLLQYESAPRLSKVRSSLAQVAVVVSDSCPTWTWRGPVGRTLYAWQEEGALEVLPQGRGADVAVGGRGGRDRRRAGHPGQRRQRQPEEEACQLHRRVRGRHPQGAPGALPVLDPHRLGRVLEEGGGKGHLPHSNLHHHGRAEQSRAPGHRGRGHRPQDDVDPGQGAGQRASWIRGGRDHLSAGQRTLRLIVRRQRKQAGEQLSFDDLDGFRVFALNTNLPAIFAPAVTVEHHHRTSAADRQKRPSAS
jgi:hypothetical protein